MYFTAAINGIEVPSNELYYAIIWIQTLNATPVISSSFHETTVARYPSIESYIISNFKDKTSTLRFQLGKDAKAYIGENADIQTNKIPEYVQFYNFERINMKNDLTPFEIRSKAA